MENLSQIAAIMFGCIPVMIDVLDHRHDKAPMAQPFEARIEAVTHHKCRSKAL